MRVAFVTGHTWHSAHRAGFHHLADAVWRRGHEVLFWTTCLSHLSRLRRDPRLSLVPPDERNRLRRLGERLWSYVWFTPWHPANLRVGILNRLAAPLWRRYGALDFGAIRPWLAAADVIVMESVPALLATEAIAAAAPRARLVYRVSDDVRMLGHHAAVREVEDRLAPRFDLISLPNPIFLDRFPAATTQIHPHGVDPAVFERTPARLLNGPWRAHVVFTGMSLLDRRFLAVAAARRPKVAFHLLGPFAPEPVGANLHWHGEVPFEESVAFLKGADAGLHTLRWVPGGEWFANSLKVRQYTHVGLPYVAPDYLRTDRPNGFWYDPSDPDSMVRALDGALARGRMPPAEPAWTWDDVAGAIFDAVTS